MRRALVLLPLLVAALALPTTTHPAAHDVRDGRDGRATSPRTAHQAARREATPRLRVRVVARHLDHPWDVRPLPEGTVAGGALLVTQRDRAALSLVTGGRVHRIRFPSRDVWVAGETGLMGLAVDPDFAVNRRIYTCQGGFTHPGHDVRVVAWRLSTDLTRVSGAQELVGGLPTSTGRHGGCRLLIDRDGSLLVGTGDAAQGTNPEDLDSLGGKTLRLDRITGAPWPSNPYAAAAGARRYVQTFGHRNVQGLAQRADGTLWSIEQGTDRDDEVNQLVAGGDYGYNPVPGYNETVPMTDPSLPGPQVPARWRSGYPTLATSGGTFVTGSQWGDLDGALAVACLKAERVVMLGFDAAGRLQQTRTPAPLRRFGRIRTVVGATNGDLLLTTDNGGGADLLLRVSPH